MPRTRPPERLDALVEAAALELGARGYRRTQMADVARRLGVAAGTLYAYVEGKEALLDLVVQRAFRDTPGPSPTLPVPAPSKDELVAHLRARLRSMGGRHPLLRDAEARPAASDAAAEVEAVVCELYDFLARHWRLLRLLERVCVERPELGDVYYARGRSRMLGRWARWIERRADEGAFLPVPDAQVAARLWIETIAWFAWHRHGDPDRATIDDATARETVVLFAQRALLKESR